jgi:hypothetical protein
VALVEEGDMADERPPRLPAWLLGLGGLALAVIGLALGYAVVIGVANFSRIGV